MVRSTRYATSVTLTCFHYGAMCTQAKLVLDGKDRLSRFGYVTFATAEQAKAAIADLDNKELDGKTIVVKLAGTSEVSTGGWTPCFRCNSYPIADQ